MSTQHDFLKFLHRIGQTQESLPKFFEVYESNFREIGEFLSAEINTKNELLIPSNWLNNLFPLLKTKEDWDTMSTFQVKLFGGNLRKPTYFNDPEKPHKYTRLHGKKSQQKTIMKDKLSNSTNFPTTKKLRFIVKASINVLRKKTKEIPRELLWENLKIMVPEAGKIQIDAFSVIFFDKNMKQITSVPFEATIV
ncbi:MAG: hypothetical protein ABFQ53_00115 [Patescibacteria group bacterium]